MFFENFIKNEKILKNVFGHFWPFFDNIWFFWPLHIKVRIQKIHFPSTKNSGSPFLDPKLQFLFFIFPNVRLEIRTFEILVERLGKWRVEIGVWGPKTGFQNFSLKQNGSFEYKLWYAEVENIRYYRKNAKNDQKDLSFFSKFL